MCACLLFVALYGCYLRARASPLLKRPATRVWAIFSSVACGIRNFGRIHRVRSARSLVRPHTRAIAERMRLLHFISVAPKTNARIIVIIAERFPVGNKRSRIQIAGQSGRCCGLGRSGCPFRRLSSRGIPGEALLRFGQGNGTTATTEPVRSTMVGSRRRRRLVPWALCCLFNLCTSEPFLCNRCDGPPGRMCSRDPGCCSHSKRGANAAAIRRHRLTVVVAGEFSFGIEMGLTK